jgi:SAM-dependent methyltransferase
VNVWLKIPPIGRLKGFAVNAAGELSNRRRYARVAALYDLLDWPCEPLYRPGRAFIGRLASGVTLELGAGTGKTFAYYGQASRVFGLDASWAMLSRARRRIRPPVRALLLGDVAHLPVRDRSAETVTATFVCCVQADPRPAVREIARVLRPGGRAVFLEYVLPRRGPLRWLMRLLEPPLRLVYGLQWQHDLPASLNDAGLRVLEVRPMRPRLIQAFVCGR